MIKIIKVSNPVTEAHKSARAIAFNCGRGTEVNDNNINAVTISWTDGTLLAIFEKIKESL